MTGERNGDVKVTSRLSGKQSEKEFLGNMDFLYCTMQMFMSEAFNYARHARAKATEWL